jgi:hypothetical protein
MHVQAVIPLAVALLYVEVQLSSHHPDLYVPYLWLWICVFEFIFGIPLAWFNGYVQNLVSACVCSRRLRAKLAAAPILFAHIVVQCHYEKTCHIGGTVLWVLILLIT